ncbi:MAG: hypothetical protein PWP27_2050, partial [Clostridiales bacterium]|nr:hypothetical protein [Clostridiales bacterium]
LEQIEEKLKRKLIYTWSVEKQCYFFCSWYAHPLYLENILKVF